MVGWLIDGRMVDGRMVDGRMVDSAIKNIRLNQEVFRGVIGMDT